MLKSKYCIEKHYHSNFTKTEQWYASDKDEKYVNVSEISYC